MYWLEPWVPIRHHSFSPNNDVRFSIQKSIAKILLSVQGSHWNKISLKIRTVTSAMGHTGEAAKRARGKFFALLLMLMKTKKSASKVAHNRPKPFISQSSPAHRPQPRIDFSYYEISEPDICSLICAVARPTQWRQSTVFILAIKQQIDLLNSSETSRLCI